MLKIVLQVEGMRCGMCEAHINDIVRRTFPVKKVVSSHKRGETVVICEQDIDDARLQNAIESAGYAVLSVTREPYKPKGGPLWFLGK